MERALLGALFVLGAVSCRGASRTSVERGQVAASGSETSAPTLRLNASGRVRRQGGAGEAQTRTEPSEIPHAPSHRKHAGLEQPRSQHVACNEMGFVRLLPTGFEGFRYHDFAPTFRRNKGTFTHVVAQAGHGYLLAGPDDSLAYYQPNTHVQTLARLPALGAFQMWSDVRRRDWVWVHYLRDDAVHRFALPAAVSMQPGEVEGERSMLAEPVLLDSVELPQFDGKSVSRAFSGGWIYTRTDDQMDNDVLLVSGWGKTGTARAREATVSLTDIDGRQLEIALKGYPFSMVESEGRVALVTHLSRSGGRDWQLEVITTSGKLRRVDLPSQIALEPSPNEDAFATEVANRSLCFVPGRPWIVVGGKTAVRVFAYDTGRTLLTLGQ